MNDLQKTFVAVRRAMDWMPEANCRNMDVELFFPIKSSNYDPFVKEVCGSCPVQEECLWYANQTSAEEGYFGNMTPMQRRAWRKKNNVSMGQSKAEWENRNRGYLRAPRDEWSKL